MALREVANKYLSSCDMTWTGGYTVTTTWSYFTLHDTARGFVVRGGGGGIERRSCGTMKWILAGLDHRRAMPINTVPYLLSTVCPFVCHQLFPLSFSLLWLLFNHHPTCLSSSTHFVLCQHSSDISVCYPVASFHSPIILWCIFPIFCLFSHCFTICMPF